MPPARRTIALTLCATLAVACLAIPALAGANRVTTARSGAPSPPRPAITGFQPESAPGAAIDRSAAALTTVGVDGVNLEAGGAAVGAPDAQARAQLARAHADGLRAELLVGSFFERINDFSEPLAHGLLGSQTRVARIAAVLAGDVTSEGWNGISLDLESLTARDTTGLVAFVQALRSRLPAADTISVNIMNETSASQYRTGGYDLGALGREASRLILMAYDEHGPWEATPGSVGALAWQAAG